MMDREQRRKSVQSYLDGQKSHAERNLLGQFSTPYPLAVEIMNYVKRLVGHDEKVAFLEPACGTGVFYSALVATFEREQIETARGYEIDADYYSALNTIWENEAFDIRHGDFLQQSPESSFSLIVANPPYSRHHHLTSDRKASLKRLVYDRFGINISSLSGLYCYFLLLSTSWLKEGGISCWLIPSEFLDVNYGKAVKEFLLKRVTLLSIHRFQPDDLQFSDALVSSSVVLFRNSPPQDHVISFSTGGSLASPQQLMTYWHHELSSNLKWSSCFRQCEGVSVYTHESETLGDYFEVKRGLVTGNNDFFLVDRKTIELYELPGECLTPMLPGPRYLAEDVVELSTLAVHEPGIQLFSCTWPESRIRMEYPRMWEYIQKGYNQHVHEGYICSRRTPWYSCEHRSPAPFLVPYMSRHSQRGKLFRFILNRSNALATNVYLLLYPRENIVDKIQDFGKLESVWKFLNNISDDIIARCGRVYGGGLHKLEPRELSAMPVTGFRRIIS